MAAMPHARTAGTLLILFLLAPAAACQRHAPESRVKSVEARIDGITCPTCVPPLTASLKRHYKESAVDVSDEKDTATIQFAENEAFSPAEFRAAVERVRMHVIRVRMQACGTVQTADGKKWLTAGSNRFLLQSDGDLPPDEPVCADGTLDSQGDPATFHVSAFRVQGASGH
jgi:hypothetical protein